MQGMQGWFGHIYHGYIIYYTITIFAHNGTTNICEQYTLRIGNDLACRYPAIKHWDRNTKILRVYLHLPHAIRNKSYIQAKHWAQHEDLRIMDGSVAHRTLSGPAFSDMAQQRRCNPSAFFFVLLSNSMVKYMKILRSRKYAIL